MNTDLHVLRQAKAQLNQLQKHVENLYEHSGTAAGLPESLQAAKKAQLIVQELGDRWPAVQKLLNHNVPPSRTAELVQAAWQRHEQKTWHAEAREHSNAALAVIEKHQCTHLALRPSKRPRTDTPLSASVAELRGVVQRVHDAVPSADLHFFCAHLGRTGPPESANEIRMVLPKTLVACVSLLDSGRPVPVRVMVDTAEKRADAYGWSSPSALVFRRVTALANRALCYFTKRAQQRQEDADSMSSSANAQRSAAQNQPPAAPAAAAAPGAAASSSAEAAGTALGGGLPQAAGAQQPAAGTAQQQAGGGQQSGASTSQSRPSDGAAGSGGPGVSPGAVALEDLLLWLCSFQDLFTRPCEATGKLLAWDPSSHYPIPPTFRAFMMSRADLQRAATDPSFRTAYHLHHAPPELLNWQEEGPLPPLPEDLLGSSEDEEAPPSPSAGGTTAALLDGVPSHPEQGTPEGVGDATHPVADGGATRPAADDAAAGAAPAEAAPAAGAGPPSAGAFAGPAVAEGGGAAAPDGADGSSASAGTAAAAAAGAAGSSSPPATNAAAAAAAAPPDAGAPAVADGLARDVPVERQGTAEEPMDLT